MTPRTRQRATNAKAPAFRTARFALRLRPSEIEGFVVYAIEDIPARRVVIEYTGEKITLKEGARRRTHMMRSRGPKRAYWFCVYFGRRCYVLDGSVDGSGAEYINHSCDPNLLTRLANCRLLLYSRRVIQTGEELTLDYGYSPESERVECRCGSPKCRGTINRLK